MKDAGWTQNEAMEEIMSVPIQAKARLTQGKAQLQMVKLVMGSHEQ